MDKKYEMTNETKVIECDGEKVTLHRIKALKDFGNVKEGDLGGFIESENNLSHRGESWVYDNAEVYGDAIIFNNVKIFGNAKVCDNAIVHGNAMVFGDSMIFGIVELHGDIRVFGNARLFN